MTRTRPRKNLSSKAATDAAENRAILGNVAALSQRIRKNLAALYREEAREEAHARVRMAQAIRGPRRSKLPACGARCRDGPPCRLKVEPWRDRCRLHGGLSTGPRTDAGKARLSASMAERWAAWRRGEGPKPGRQPKPDAPPGSPSSAG